MKRLAWNAGHAALFHDLLPDFSVEFPLDGFEIAAEDGVADLPIWLQKVEIRNVVGSVDEVSPTNPLLAKVVEIVDFLYNTFARPTA